MSSIFRPEVLARQQQRLQGQINLTRPPQLVWLSLLLLVIAVLSISFLLSADYTRKETVQGLLQPVQGQVRVQAQNSGVVSKLNVQEGQQVKAGTPLLQLNSSKIGAGQTDLSQSLQTEMGRMLDNKINEQQQLQQRHQLELQALQNQITNDKARLQELALQLVTFRERLSINQQQLAQLQKLSGSGYISGLEINKQKDALLALQQQEKSLQSEQLKLQQQLQQNQDLLSQLPLRQQTELAQIDNQLSALKNQRTELQQQQEIWLTAPVDGQVSALRVSAGQTLDAGAVALTLLPVNAELEAILYVPTRSIAFVSAGQPVRIRYDAFPFQRFGVFSGTVHELSNTVLLPSEVAEVALQQPSYRLKVRLSGQSIQAYQRELPLKAGMTLQADLITEQRNLWQWLFDPILALRGQF